MGGPRRESSLFLARHSRALAGPLLEAKEFDWEFRLDDWFKAS